MSRDALDLLLDEVREPWPTDKAFVDTVMNDVRAYETRRRFTMRRPMVFGLAVAAVVTGGAVAAVVGTNPTPAKQAIVSSAPTHSVGLAAPKRTSTGVTVKPPASASAVPSAPGVVQKARGYATDHTSFAFDTKTGLKLITETYTNSFTTSKSQRVTLTLINTGKTPLAFNSQKDCALQVMAYPASEAASTYTNPEDYSGNFEWVCAGSDADPRTATIPDSFVLASGATKTVDAQLTISKPGQWNVVGMCKCSYSKVSSPSPDKSNPLDDLTRRALPSPLLPQRSDGANLSTPPIRVRSE